MKKIIYLRVPIFYVISFCIILLWATSTLASTILYQYDLNGRLLRADYAGKTIDYSYDNAGNLLRRDIRSGSGQFTDTDHDGIDDNWENYYFGDLTTADQYSDFDKDGYSDLQEYKNQQSGETDPLGNVYNPTVINAPHGTGYNAPYNFLLYIPAIISGDQHNP